MRARVSFCIEFGFFADCERLIRAKYAFFAVEPFTHAPLTTQRRRRLSTMRPTEFDEQFRGRGKSGEIIQKRIQANGNARVRMSRSPRMLVSNKHFPFVRSLVCLVRPPNSAFFLLLVFPAVHSLLRSGMSRGRDNRLTIRYNVRPFRFAFSQMKRNTHKMRSTRANNMRKCSLFRAAECVKRATDEPREMNAKHRESEAKTRRIVSLRR